jgi:hypothetical protein
MKKSACIFAGNFVSLLNFARAEMLEAKLKVDQYHFYSGFEMNASGFFPSGNGRTSVIEAPTSPGMSAGKGFSNGLGFQLHSGVCSCPGGVRFKK